MARCVTQLFGNRKKGGIDYEHVHVHDHVYVYVYVYVIVVVIVLVLVIGFPCESILNGRKY